LAVDLGHARLSGQQLGALGQRVQTVTKPIDDGVVSLQLEEVVEDGQSNRS
jgi:hypothetical protein